MDYIIVGIGGIFGSIARYLLGKIISKRANSNSPFGTFIINITGAILLGIVSSVPIQRSFYILIADGFLGAYTTFSTFMYEGFNVYKDNRKLNAVIYIISSVILGILGFILGIKLCLLLK